MINPFFQRILSSIRSKGVKAELVRGSFGVGALNSLSMPLALATSILLARWLGPEAYGQYIFVLSIISILALPLGPGLGQLVTRQVARYQHSEEWGLFRGLLRLAHQWVIAGSTIMAVAIILLAVRNASWASDDRWTLLFLATLLLPLLGFNALRSGTLRGLRNVFYAHLPEMLARPGLHLIIVCGLMLSGVLNPATALASQIIATAFALGIGGWFLWRLKPVSVTQAQPDYRHKEWTYALLPFTLLSAVGTLNGEIGILLLGWLGDSEDIAALRVAMSGAVLVAMPLSIVNMVIGPYISRAHQDNDKSGLQRLSRQSARAALATALPIALPLIFFGGPIVQFVFGDVYRDTATLPLLILSIGQLVNVGFGSVGMFLTMSGYERDTLSGQIVALLVNATAALILIPSFGAVGAALSVAIGLVTWNLILAMLIIKRLGLRPSAL